MTSLLKKVPAAWRDNPDAHQAHRTHAILQLREGAKLLVYQYRFVKPKEKVAKGSSEVTPSSKEYGRWKEYFWNLQQLCDLPLELSELLNSERKGILERVKKFQWTKKRTRLMREPVGSKG